MLKKNNDPKQNTYVIYQKVQHLENVSVRVLLC